MTGVQTCALPIYDEERNGAVKDSVGCVQAADDLVDDYASSRATEEEIGRASCRERV